MNTTSTVSFRTKVFNRAHAIRKATGECFAICLLRSWQVYKLAKRMSVEPVRFAFKKVDGSLRYATGRLFALPETKGTGTSNDLTLPYFDVEANGWRSFRAESLLSIQ